jgi:hypothetical protein
MADGLARAFNARLPPPTRSSAGKGIITAILLKDAHVDGFVSLMPANRPGCFRSTPTKHPLQPGVLRVRDHAVWI